MRRVDPDAVRPIRRHGEADPVPVWGTGGYPLRVRVFDLGPQAAGTSLHGYWSLVGKGLVGP